MQGHSSKSFLRNIGLPILSDIKVSKHKNYKLSKLADESTKKGTLSACGLNFKPRQLKQIGNKDAKQRRIKQKLQAIKYESMRYKSKVSGELCIKNKKGKQNKSNNNTIQNINQNSNIKITSYTNQCKPLSIHQITDKQCQASQLASNCNPQSYRYKSMDIQQHYNVRTPTHNYLRSISYNKIKSNNKIIPQNKINFRYQSHPILNLKHHAKFKYDNNVDKQKYPYPHIQNCGINFTKSVHNHQLAAIRSPKINTQRQQITTDKDNEYLNKNKRRFLTQVQQQIQQRSEKIIDQQYINEEISSIIDLQYQRNNQMKCKGAINFNRNSNQECSILENIKQIQSMLSNHKNNCKQEQNSDKIQQANENSEEKKLQNFKGKRQFRILTVDSLPKPQQPECIIPKKRNKDNNNNHFQSLPTLQSLQFIMNQNSSKKKARMLHKCNSIIMRSIDKLKGIFPVGFFQDTVQMHAN